MTNEEILKLAKECGIKIDPRFGEIYTGNVQLATFYHAAYNAGLEAAAKVCEFERTKFGGHHMPSHAVAAGMCADAIRALEMK